MREITYAQAIREALEQQMKLNDKVIMFGQEIGIYGGTYGVTDGLYGIFGPDRIIDTPISEQALVGMGIGAALVGLRPIVEIMFSDFILLAMDQIGNQAAKIRYMFGGHAKVPLVIRTPFGGGLGMAAQHSQCLEALFIHFPGLKVAVPSTPYDIKGLLSSALKDDNPVLIFEHKALYNTKGQVPEVEYKVKIGTADCKRKGRDLTVVATSLMVGKVLNVAEKLYGEGIDIEVIDPRTLKPLDMGLITESVKKTNRLVLVEEACYTGGFTCYLASEISSQCFDFLDAPIKRVASLDCPIPYEHNLENAVIPNEEKIEKAIRETLR